MQSAANLGMRIDILRAITRLFSLNSHIRHSFRDVHGFVYVLSVLLNISKLQAEGEGTAGGELVVTLIAATTSSDDRDVSC